MAHATVAELAEYLGHTPDDAARMLDRASRLVDLDLRAAVYDVDDAGQPTNPNQASAIRDATLEQCAVWDEAGSTGLPGPAGVQSVAAGGISLTRAAQATSAVDTDRLAPSARVILDAAGLTGRPQRRG